MFNYELNKHFTKYNVPLLTEIIIFKLLVNNHIINSITLLGEAFSYAHLDTSFASIDPKIMKLHPIEGTYPRI